MAEDIRVERQDGWIEVTIHRPDKLNAIREQTAIEILDVMTEVEADRSLRGLIITGSDKAFCTGVDTSEQKNEPDEAFELWRRRKRSRVNSAPAIAAAAPYPPRTPTPSSTSGANPPPTGALAPPRSSGILQARDRCRGGFRARRRF